MELLVLYLLLIKSTSPMGQDLKVDIVMEVCFKPLDQDEKSNEGFFKQLRSLWLSWRDCDLSGVFCKGNTARHEEPRRFLEDVRDNLLTQVLDRLSSDAQTNLLFTDRENPIRDRINNGSVCYSDHEIVELEILR